MTLAATPSRAAKASTAGRSFAAPLRALLQRRMQRAAGAGRAGRANPFRRLAAAVLTAGRAVPPIRPDQPAHPPATNTMPFGPVRLAALGLGLAGGGGGSPGRPPARVRPGRVPAPRRNP